MHHSRLRVAVVVLSISAAVSDTARADPITVTSGVANITWDDPAGFVLQGDGLHLFSFFVSIPVFPPPLESCGFSGGCAPGTSLNLSSVMGGGQTQTAVVNSVTYATQSQPETWIDLRGRLVFEAGDVIAPLLPDDLAGSISLLSPFTFNGRVAGFRPGETVPLFQIDLTGRGRADLRLVPEGSVWRFNDLDYNFENPAVVPEPMSVLLVASGLAGLLGSQRGRRAWRAKQ
jgi:hypothetical protein